MKKKVTQVAALALALSVGFATGAMALGDQNVTAILSRTIGITYNGEAQTFKDVNGNEVLPLVYNGSTYLPVRGVADLVGLPVDYDAATKTVVLGTTEKQPTKLTTLDHTGGSDYSFIIRDASELEIVGDTATQTYATGIAWEQWNGTMSHHRDRDIDFTVKGYSTLSFSIWSDVDAKVGLYEADGTVITTFDITAGSLISKTFDITGLETVAFGSNAPDIFNNNDGHLKILDPVVS